MASQAGVELLFWSIHISHVVASFLSNTETKGNIEFVRQILYERGPNVLAERNIVLGRVALVALLGRVIAASVGGRVIVATLFLVEWYSCYLVWSRGSTYTTCRSDTSDSTWWIDNSFSTGLNRSIRYIRPEPKWQQLLCLVEWQLLLHLIEWQQPLDRVTNASLLGRVTANLLG